MRGAVQAVAVATSAVLFVCGCSGNADPDPEQPSASPASDTTSSTSDGPPAGTFEVNGRELHLDCTGSGHPVMVLETGEGVPSSSLDPIREAYDSQMMVCGYDRANTGSSGTAPTPRKRDDVLSDLHGLLQAAEVSGPVVLVGHSAGGLIVQAYAAEHPNDVVGAVAMNAVPSWSEWSTLGFEAMTPAEQKDETAYYQGANGESLDYQDISAGTQGPGPAAPFHVLISTIAQCESKTDICGRTYPAYTEIMKSLAKRWPEGQFSQVNAPHEIYTEDRQAVTAAIDDVLKRSE